LMNRPTQLALDDFPKCSAEVFAPMYTITVSEKGGQQSTFEFNKSEVTIGRMKGNDIVLPKGNVSKRHSRIFAQDDGFKIIDLESTNGTYVNGRKITGEQAITDSDKVYIGDF